MVKQQIEVLLIAGHETTASTIAFTTLMLAMHPHIQEHFFNELHSMYDTQNERTTYEHIQKLDMLDRVLKETMRLFPPFYLFSRTSTTDISLESCVIPKGVDVVMPIYTMHRVIWECDAYSFERFIIRLQF